MEPSGWGEDGMVVDHEKDAVAFDVTQTDVDVAQVSETEYMLMISYQNRQREIENARLCFDANHADIKASMPTCDILYADFVRAVGAAFGEHNVTLVNDVDCSYIFNTKSSVGEEDIQYEIPDQAGIVLPHPDTAKKMIGMYFDPRSFDWSMEEGNVCTIYTVCLFPTNQEAVETIVGNPSVVLIHNDADIGVESAYYRANRARTIRRVKCAYMKFKAWRPVYCYDNPQSRNDMLRTRRANSAHPFLASTSGSSSTDSSINTSMDVEVFDEEDGVMRTVSAASVAKAGKLERKENAAPTLIQKASETGDITFSFSTDTKEASCNDINDVMCNENLRRLLCWYFQYLFARVILPSPKIRKSNMENYMLVRSTETACETKVDEIFRTHLFLRRVDSEILPRFVQAIKQAISEYQHPVARLINDVQVTNYLFSTDVKSSFELQFTDVNDFIVFIRLEHTAVNVPVVLYCHDAQLFEVFEWIMRRAFQLAEMHRFVNPDIQWSHVLSRRVPQQPRPLDQLQLEKWAQALDEMDDDDDAVNVGNIDTMQQ